MSHFVQLHLLTSYPPANLNRDDLGRPKTAKMGGVESSARFFAEPETSVRTSDLFERAMKDHLGTRTKEMGRKVYARLEEKGIGHKDALTWARTIVGVFGKLKELDEEREGRASRTVAGEKEREGTCRG